MCGKWIRIHKTVLIDNVNSLRSFVSKMIVKSDNDTKITRKQKDDQIKLNCEDNEPQKC